LISIQYDGVMVWCTMCDCVGTGASDIKSCITTRPVPDLYQPLKQYVGSAMSPVSKSGVLEAFSVKSRAGE
jgi:hypothetical protein